MSRRREGLSGKEQAEPGCPGRNIMCKVGQGWSVSLLVDSFCTAKHLRSGFSSKGC